MSTKRKVDVLVIGGGAGGMAAALGAHDAGASHVLIVESQECLGGILQQCIHNGFGLHRYNQELTGPEYAAIDRERIISTPGIDVMLNTTVVSISSDKVARMISPREGQIFVEATAIIMSLGSRERTRGSMRVAGSRPAGVYSAGTAQKLINLDGALVGKRVVIVGSGDVGLIMARRMTYEGAKVVCVTATKTTASGLRRNVVQCLDDYGIPLLYKTTITRIVGADRLEGVYLAEVTPPSRKPNPGSEYFVACDTLLFSSGLLPENRLAMDMGIPIDRTTKGPFITDDFQTDVPGVFVCGNQLHIHDLVDYVSEEGLEAGRAAAHYVLSAGTQLLGTKKRAKMRQVVSGSNVSGVSPQYIRNETGDITFRFRSKEKIAPARIVVRCGGSIVKNQASLVVVPSEMQSVKVSAEKIATCGGDITIDILKKEGKGE